MSRSTTAKNIETGGWIATLFNALYQRIGEENKN